MTKTRRAPEVQSELTNKGGRWDKLDRIFQAATKIRIDACIEIATLLANDGILQRDPRYITQDDIAERYGISQQRISDYQTIGNDKRVTAVAVTELPNSIAATRELVNLPDREFEQCCKPNITRDAIREVAKRLAPPTPAPVTPQPTPTPAPARPKCPGVESDNATPPQIQRDSPHPGHRQRYLGKTTLPAPVGRADSLHLRGTQPDVS